MTIVTGKAQQKHFSNIGYNHGVTHGRVRNI